MKRAVPIMIGLFLAVFGGLCLNYTKAGVWEHHTQFAREHNAPPPSSGIMWTGAATILAGGTLLGYGLGQVARRTNANSK